MTGPSSRPLAGRLQRPRTVAPSASASAAPSASTSAAPSTSTSTSASPATKSEGPRRRPPVWLLALVGALVVGLVVVAVVVLGGRSAPEQAPAPAAEPQTVTLAPPQPAIDPVPRDALTPFFDALPSTVLGYALTEHGPDPSLVAAGALESYRMVYSDGGTTTIAVTAGQWATPEAAAAVYQSIIQARTAEVAAGGAGDAGDTTETAAPGTEVEEGPVLVGGAEVGRFMLVPRGDGTGTLTWINGTVVLQADGPAEALRDLHTAFPL